MCPKPTFDGGGISVSLVNSTEGNHLHNLRFISPDIHGTYYGGYTLVPNYVIQILQVTPAPALGSIDQWRHIHDIFIPEVGGASYVADFDTKPFTPVFIDSITNYKCIRFMDWMATNGQNIAEWTGQ